MTSKKYILKTLIFQWNIWRTKKYYNPISFSSNKCIMQQYTLLNKHHCAQEKSKNFCSSIASYYWSYKLSLIFFFSSLSSPHLDFYEAFYILKNTKTHINNSLILCISDACEIYLFLLLWIIFIFVKKNFFV